MKQQGTIGWTTFKILLTRLTKHKKKMFSVLVLAFFYFLYRKKKMRLLLDKSLENVQKMVIKELQKNKTRSQQIQQEFGEFKLMSLKYSQNQLKELMNQKLDIEGIRRELQQKNTSQEQKYKLWGELKNQAILYIQIVMIQYGNINFMEYLKDLVPKILMKMKDNNQINQIHDSFDIQKQTEQIISALQNQIVEYQKTHSQLTWIHWIAKTKHSEQFDLDQMMSQFQEIQQQYMSLQQMDQNIEQCIIVGRNDKKTGIRGYLKKLVFQGWKSLFIKQQVQKSIGVQAANIKWILEMVSDKLTVEKDNLNTIIYKILLDILGSQNYQVYNCKQVEFMNQKLSNRIKYYFIKQNKKDYQMGYVMYLIIIYKIIQEEFLDESSEENNSNFYQKIIKKNYHLIREDDHSNDQDDQLEIKNKQFELGIIKEFQKYQELASLKSSIGRKFFFSQAVIDMIDNQTDEQANQKDKQIKQNIDGNSLIDLLNQL